MTVKSSTGDLLLNLALDARENSVFITKRSEKKDKAPLVLSFPEL